MTEKNRIALKLIYDIDWEILNDICQKAHCSKPTEIAEVKKVKEIFNHLDRIEIEDEPLTPERGFPGIKKTEKLNFYGFYGKFPKREGPTLSLQDSLDTVSDKNNKPKGE